MNDEAQSAQPQGMALGDIYYVLFRHKWLILLFSSVGLLAAIMLIASNPPLYKSQTTLTIRYVEEGKSLNKPGNESNARSLNDQAIGILITEAQILQSFDVALRAAAAFGPEKILAKAGGGSDTNAAAALIAKHLEVELPAKGTVISIVLRHPDPTVPQALLGEVVVAYIKKQMVLHQNVAIFGDVLTNETARLRSELARTEDQLKEAKQAAGVTTSVDEAKAGYATRILKLRADLDNAEVELAQHKAALAQSGEPAPAISGTTNTEQEMPVEKISQYKRVCALLDELWKKDQQLSMTFTDSNPLVQENRQRIADSEMLKKELINKYPRLAVTAVPSSTAGQPAGVGMDASTGAMQARAIQSKIEILNSKLSEIQTNAARVDEMETTIRELQSKKEVQEIDLKYFSTKLEQARIEAGVGDGKAPNIGTIDSPTPVGRSRPKSFWKKVSMVGLGGMAAGVALAFVIEMVLDRSVKRPSEVESKLGMPLFISIPDLGRNGKRRRAKATGNDPLLLTDRKGGTAEGVNPMEISAADRNHPLRRYYEGLRNRLIVRFEIWNLKHKPKMVAVTSCGNGAGVTSTAAGLAASLSETGDGSVLLVDMNCEQGAAQHFYKGKPACGLEDALTSQAAKTALVRTNLYTDAGDKDNKLPQALPSRFATLVPKFKASDYDFIIFDMPPVSQTSVTARLAGFMDMVLLVIESEKTNQDVVKQANALLAESKANVSAVLNKTRTYVPARLRQDLNDA